jgi:hypothetical protein
MAIGKSHTFNGRTVDGSSIYRIPENLIVPYQFTSLPTNIQGQVRWTEDAPIGWNQYGPYYNLFNKVYLRRDGSLETIPNGGGNVHSMKAFGLGTTVGQLITLNLTTGTLNPAFNNSWSVPRISYSINIPADKSYVNFGCFYKVPANDRLRPKNFGAIYLHFNIPGDNGRNSSYFNFYAIGGESVGNFVGNTFPNYRYINDYLGLDSYIATYQWIGQNVIKLRQLGLVNQSPGTDDWQFLNFKVEIPTFSTTAPNGNDYYDGRPVSCTMALCFGEAADYLNVLPRVDSGSVLFYYPFLYFS